jgi:hypothetical protein
MQYGLFPWGLSTYSCKFINFRYCVSMVHDRPELDLKNFDDICPDKDGTSEHNFMNWASK